VIYGPSSSSSSSSVTNSGPLGVQPGYARTTINLPKELRIRRNRVRLITEEEEEDEEVGVEDNRDEESTLALGGWSTKRIISVSKSVISSTECTLIPFQLTLIFLHILACNEA
jgi:hypothetical protein